MHHCALQETQETVSLHRACCHHELCSVLHKGFGEQRQVEVVVVWGLVSALWEKFGAPGRQQQGAVCAADGSAALPHV